MTFRVDVAPDGPAFTVARGERILAAGRRAGVWLPFECGWGSCGRCKVTLVDGTVEPLGPEVPARTARDARRRRILTCQSTPTSDLTIKPLRVDTAPPAVRPTGDHDAELAEVVEVGPDIRRFTFRLDRPTRFREGQYAVLDLGEGLRRCYSMANRPGTDHVEFVSRRRPGGAGSERLHGLRPGARIAVELPYGDVWVRPDDGPVLLVAGGTGISPVLAMVRRLAAHRDPRPVRVVYGAGSEAELACWSSLRALVAELPDGRLHGAVAAPGPAWTGIRGLVTDALVHAVPDPLAAARCYLAGPPPMVDATVAWLGAAGLGLDRVHVDRFG